jgi:hypothetical protein
MNAPTPRFYPFNAFRPLLGIAGDVKGADLCGALFGLLDAPNM